MGQPRHGYWCIQLIEAGKIGQAGATYTETAVAWQTVIHLTFILSAIGIAFVDRLGQFALARRHKPEPAE